MPVYIADPVYKDLNKNTVISEPIEFTDAKDLLKKHKNSVNSSQRNFMGYHIVAIKRLKMVFLHQNLLVEKNIEEILDSELT